MVSVLLAVVKVSVVPGGFSDGAADSGSSESGWVILTEKAQVARGGGRCFPGGRLLS